MNMLPHDPAKGEDLRNFIDCIFLPDDLVEVRLLPSKQSSWCQAKALPGRVDSLVRKNATGEHIYFGTNPRRSNGRKSEHVKLARNLFADFDNTDVDAVLERLAQTGFPDPTVIVNSGHGVHCYWRLDEAITDLAYWSQLQKRLARLLGSDSKVSDPPRIMRLPGFLNHKEPIALAGLIMANSKSSYSLTTLVAFLPELSPRGDSSKQTISSLKVVSRAIAYLESCKPAIAGQKGHESTLIAARAVVLGFDLGIEIGHELLSTHYNQRCKPPWTEAELRYKCEEADRLPSDKPRGHLLNSDNHTSQLLDIDTQRLRNSDTQKPSYIETQKPRNSEWLSSESLRHSVSVSTRKLIFDYARELKAEIPEALAPDLMNRFRDWLDQKIPALDFTSGWTAFLKAWLKVKHAKGNGPIDKAYAIALATPIDLRHLGFGADHSLGIMAALCRELQKLRGDCPFPLACRPAGSLFGVSHTQAYDWLVILESLKIIQCTRKGVFKNHLASEYRYLGDSS